MVGVRLRMLESETDLSYERLLRAPRRFVWNATLT